MGDLKSEWWATSFRNQWATSSEYAGAGDDTAEARHQTKVVLVDKVEGGASPASYIMKYVLKSLAGGVTAADGQEDETDLADMLEHARESNAHRAWLSSRGLRGFRFLGAHGFMRIMQKLFTINDEELDDAAPLARDVAGCLRAMRAWGEVASSAENDENRTDANQRQTEAMADALLAAGMLRGFAGNTPRLRLASEQSETEYGRPTKRAVAISERGPDKRFGPRQTQQQFDDNGELVRWSVRGGVRLSDDDPRHAVYTVQTRLVTHLKPLVAAAYGRGEVSEPAEVVDEDGVVHDGRRVRVSHARRRDETTVRFMPFETVLHGEELAAALAGLLVVIPAHRRTASIVEQRVEPAGRVTVAAIYPSGRAPPGRGAANDPGGGPTTAAA